MTAKPLKVTGFRGNPLRVVLNDGKEAIITQKIADNLAASTGEPSVLHRLDHKVKAKIILSGSEFNIGRYTEASDDCLFIMTDEQVEPIYFNLQEADLLIAAIRAVQRDFKEG